MRTRASGYLLGGMLLGYSLAHAVLVLADEQPIDWASITFCAIGGLASIGFSKLVERSTT